MGKVCFQLLEQLPLIYERSRRQHWLIVAMPGIHQLAAVDLKTFKVTKTIDLPKNPQEVLIPPDGKTAYVSCDATKQVAAVDLQSFTVKKFIPAGKGADGLAWAAQP